MKNRRVRLGTFPSGKVGLRVSALSFDAVESIDDGHAITFDSDWTDIARITAVGIANEVVVGNTSGINLFCSRHLSGPWFQTVCRAAPAFRFRRV